MAIDGGHTEMFKIQIELREATHTHVACRTACMGVETTEVGVGRSGVINSLSQYLYRRLVPSLGLGESGLGLGESGPRGAGTHT